MHQLNVNKKSRNSVETKLNSPTRFMFKKLPCLLLVAASALATAHATTVIPPSFDDLVKHAEVIFQGTVTDVRAQWIGEGAEHRIVSFVTFKVEDAIKGAPGASYTMRMLGGTVDGQTLEVSDAPKFKTGDRDILFVENNGSQFIPLVGIQNGRFHVRHDEESGRDMVTTNSGAPLKAVADLGKDEHAITAVARNASAPVAKEQGLSVGELKSAIQSKLRNEP